MVQEIHNIKEPELQDLTDSIKDMFTEKVIDSRVEDEVNILNKIKGHNKLKTLKAVHVLSAWRTSTPNAYQKLSNSPAAINTFFTLIVF